jgi:hypothetical protein
MVPIEKGGGRRRHNIDVPSELERFRELVGPLLAPRKIALLVDSLRRSILRVEMRPETFHRILHILMTNSLEWLHGVRKIRRSTSKPRRVGIPAISCFQTMDRGSTRLLESGSSSRSTRARRGAEVWG